jgi:hypothetical protein
MAKNFLSIIAGVISSFIVIIAIESIAHILNPLPVDPKNTEVFRHYVRYEAPKTLHLLILSAYAIGSFTGGFLTAYISITKKVVHAMTLGGILMGLGIYNLVLTNHPSWVIVIGFFAFLPFAYLGGMIGRNFSEKKHLSH